MSLSDKIERIRSDFDRDINSVREARVLEELFRKYIGRNGLIRELTTAMKDLSAGDKKLYGPRINALRESISAQLEKKQLELKKFAEAAEAIDYTLASPVRIGREHPLYSTMEEILDILGRMGFEIVEGPEIETEENNFTKLNIPKEHPSHDAWNTFYVGNNLVLRSHTTPVQISVMSSRKPPIKIVCPGKTFRPDTVDAGHLPFFHQVDGLYVDKKVTLPQLKWTLETLAREIFTGVETRFRTSFFPFTEPSLELDVSCVVCKKAGCPTCRYSGWLEILGAGMVNKKVFENVGYEPDDYSGFAFGLGVERIAMLKYGIEDIRYFIDNNFRFLRNFV